MSALSVVLLLFVLQLTNGDYTQPEQVHVAATEVYSSITVTWLTFAPTKSSVVQYGLHGSTSLTMTSTGTMSEFKDHNITRYVHRVILQNLKPLTKYDYQCGSPANWSSVFTVRTLGNGSDYSPSFLVYGDFGYNNAQSMSRIRNEVNSGTVDAILHVGDMAYDMFEDDGRQGDRFMNMIQDVAVQVPYMTLPGNHEFAKNFSDYRNRFSMPGDYQSIFYSMNIGKAHIIMFSTEIYFFIEFGVAQIKTQYHWLENDLKQATTPEALAERPWVIAMGHHPMYCSTTDIDDCNFKGSIIRTGTLFAHDFSLEKLFYSYGVDMYISGHKHIYERMWPVYDNQVMNGSINAPYTNPKAPVHVVTGSAGCRERHDNFKKNQPEWVALTNRDYGYTRMKIHNGTHITIQQISDDQNGKIVDSFTLIKERHGPLAYK